MITKRSSNEIQRGHDISTRGLDILCIAAELDELESSSDESANYCTLVENSSSNNVNVVNQRNYEKKPSKKSVCSFDGCEKNAQYKGLCRGHGKVRGRKCSVEGCKGLIAYGGHGKCIKHAIQPKEFDQQ